MPTDTKPGAEPEKSEAPAHNAETGEVVEQQAEPSPADAYQLGFTARTEKRARRVPQEVTAAGEAFAEAWLSGWDAKDDELQQATKK